VIKVTLVAFDPLSIRLLLIVLTIILTPKVRLGQRSSKIRTADMIFLSFFRIDLLI
jgi:hypothetical protein